MSSGNPPFDAQPPNVEEPKTKEKRKRKRTHSVTAALVSHLDAVRGEQKELKAIEDARSQKWTEAVRKHQTCMDAVQLAEYKVEDAKGELMQAQIVLKKAKAAVGAADPGRHRRKLRLNNLRMTENLLHVLHAASMEGKQLRLYSPTTILDKTVHYILVEYFEYRHECNTEWTVTRHITCGGLYVHVQGVDYELEEGTVDLDVEEGDDMVVQDMETLCPLNQWQDTLLEMMEDSDSEKDNMMQLLGDNGMNGVDSCGLASITVPASIYLWVSKDAEPT